MRGVLGGISSRRSDCFNVISSCTIADLDATFRQFADTKSFGVEYKRNRVTLEDQAAIDIIAKGAEQLETGYELA